VDEYARLINSVRVGHIDILHKIFIDYTDESKACVHFSYSGFPCLEKSGKRITANKANSREESGTRTDPYGPVGIFTESNRRGKISLNLIISKTNSVIYRQSEEHQTRSSNMNMFQNLSKQRLPGSSKRESKISRTRYMHSSRG